VKQKGYHSSGFIDWVKALGWSIPGDIPAEELSSQCAILFTAMAFQVEEVLLIYRSLIHEREMRVEREE